MKKALLVYNPSSGDQSIPLKLDYILGRFQESNILVLPYRLINYNDNHILGILESGIIDFIIISGGDGTINHLVNLLLSNNLSIPIGVIPSGTCNDFAFSLGIPPSSSIEQCIDIILGGSTLAVDAGLINKKQYFLSTFAGGMFVDASFNTHSELKKNFGPFAYYLKALSEVKNKKAFKLKIKTDTEYFEGDALLFLVLNGTRGGGFSNLLKDADLSDGMMDIMVIKKCSNIDLAGLFFKVLSNEMKNVKHVSLYKTSVCTFSVNAHIPFSIDGEKGNIKAPIEISFVNKAITVFVP